jgi:hypothetical protein
MSEVVEIQPGAPAVLSERVDVRMSSGLAYAVGEYASRGDQVLDRLTKAEREEAGRALAAMSAIISHTRCDVVLEWLKRVGASVAKPPTVAELQMRLTSVMDTSGDLCAGAWTRETRSKFSREHGWWPSDAEIDKFLRPISDALMAKRRALHRIVNPPPMPDPEPVRAPPTEAEKQAIAAAVASIGQPTDEPLVEKAFGGRVAHLSREQLRLAYQKQADEKGGDANFVALATTRLTMLDRAP